MTVLKRFLALSILAALCAYSAWKNMQTLAIFSCVMLLGVLYHNITIRFLDALLLIIAKTKQAKFKGFELSIDDPFKKMILETIKTDNVLIKAIISDLTSDNIALLLAISKTEFFTCTNHVKNNLRELRKKALIEHDKNTLAESQKVWLTQNGKDLIATITNISNGSI